VKRVKALYRNSTFKQDARRLHGDEDKFDIPLQSRECQKFIALHPDWELIDEKSETGISGYKVSAKNRDAILQLQDEALKGEFDILLVYMFDRLGRKHDETPFILEWFINQGIEVWSVVEGQQKLETHEDSLINFMRFWVASGESRKTATRVRSKLGQMVEDGLYKGGFYPYGYKIVRQGRLNHKNREVYDLEIDENEAEIVKRIFYLASEKFYGAQKISTTLASERIRNKKGQPFSQSSINKILDNPAYIGVLRSGDTVSQIHPHLQIIEPAVFNFVQDLREKRRKTAAKVKDQTKYRNAENATSCNKVSSVPSGGKGLASGFLTCQVCGAKLWTKTKKKNQSKPYGADNPRIPIYVCHNRLYEGKQAGLCVGDDGQMQYIASKIDTAIDTMIRELLERTKQTQVNMYIKYKYQQEWKRTQTNLTNARSAYKKKQNEILAMEDKIIKSAQSDEDMSLLLPILQRLKDESEPLLEQLNACEKDSTEFVINSSEMEREHNKLIEWANLYDTADLETKQIIIAHLITSVSVKRGYVLDVDLKINFEQYDDGLNFDEIEDLTS